MGKKVSTTQCKDAGLALVLICLLVYQVKQLQLCIPLAIVFLVITMTYPQAYQPFARVWFGLSHLLGTVVSKIILSLLFVVLVLPIGLVSRALGKDSMQLKRWGKNQLSVFRTRDHRFTANDLKNPY